jgi:transcriptional antiterminator RfaH
MFEPSQSCWYAVQTRTREESRAEDNLRAWGLETMMPLVRELIYRPGRGTALRVKPLFPRYLFARFDLAASLAKVRYTRGVQNVVVLGGMPAMVPDDIIEMIRARIGADGLVRLGLDFKPGDRIRVHGGILRGFSGIFQADQNDGTRVAILLDTLRSQTRVIIERDFLRRVSPAS